MNPLTRAANARCPEPVARRRRNPVVSMDSTSRALHLLRTRGNRVLADSLGLGFMASDDTAERGLSTLELAQLQGIDAPALAVHSEHPMRLLGPGEIPEVDVPSTVDYLFTSPPCAGFSKVLQGFGYMPPRDAHTNSNVEKMPRRKRQYVDATPSNR